MNFIPNRLICYNHTEPCYCVCIVSVTSASRYVTSTSRYQSRSSMYNRGLIPRNSTELAESVPIDRRQEQVGSSVQTSDYDVAFFVSIKRHQHVIQKV